MNCKYPKENKMQWKNKKITYIAQFENYYDLKQKILF